MNARPTIPQHQRDVTPAWMQSVLDHAGHRGEVATIDLASIGTGQMAKSLRAEINYGEDSATGPASVVIKTESDDKSSRAAGAQGAYLKEVRFYQQLSSDLAVRTPAMLFAAIDEPTNNFVLVLEDLRPAKQGDQIDGCSAEQAQLAAVNIAGLHGPSWQDDSLRDLAWLTVPADQLAEAHTMAHEIMNVLTDGFIDRYRTQLDDNHVELLQWFAARTDRWLTVGADRFALTHADHRLDNLLFGTPEGGYPVATVDWQTLGLRNPLADIAYLLGTGLDVDVRRSTEVDIVNDYHRRLVEFGVDGYPADLCYDDYRAQSFHALLITVLGSMMTGQTERGDRMFMTMLRRSAQQIADLDARSLMP